MKINKQFQDLNRRHQKLLREWRRNRGLCIICGECEGDEKDHLPPKVLFPAALRSHQTEFLTYPVCSKCNRRSSNEDFLFSVLLSFGLSQEAIRRGQMPTDPDLLALYEQTHGHLIEESKSERRKHLLLNYIGTDPSTGMDAIDTARLPVAHTTTKIVKSIYWLGTGGDILQNHNPGWWIRPFIDTSRVNFIEKHLKVTNVDIQWGDRFIARHITGHPANGVGGLISCSLHFYTKRALGQGMNWYLIAAPVKSTLDGDSLYQLCQTVLGEPTIEPDGSAVQARS